jgi:hypothetical protein
MLKKPIIVLMAAMVLITSVPGAAAIVPLTSPAEFIYPANTIDFDDGPKGTVANTRYLTQGVVFSRDDGFEILLEDWQGIGRFTTSPPNVLATIKFPAPTWVMHLNTTFSWPIFELGAFFGNDQGYGYTATKLSIFDSHGVLLGSVRVPTNNNTSVDQFIGLRSDMPFYSARFENDGIWLAIALDDMSFTVPEPCTFSLLVLGGLTLLRKRKTSR